jgi:antitoxin VapB
MRLAERLMELGRHCAALPDIDARSPEEIVGYDETGMWR